MSHIEEVRKSLMITPADTQEANAREKARTDAITEVTGKPYVRPRDHYAEGNYGSVTFGPDGSIVSRKGGPNETSAAEEAVLKAKSIAQDELNRMQKELDRLVEMRDAISGYDAKGAPKFVYDEHRREMLRKQAAGMVASINGQAQINELRWRREASAKLDKLEAFENRTQDPKG